MTITALDLNKDRALLDDVRSKAKALIDVLHDLDGSPRSDPRFKSKMLAWARDCIEQAVLHAADQEKEATA